MNKSLKNISINELKTIAKMYNVITSGTKKQLANNIIRLRNLKFKE